eukprot:15479638-Alexandrium_andersonii.AAC.1
MDHACKLHMFGGGLGLASCSGCSAGCAGGASAFSYVGLRLTGGPAPRLPVQLALQHALQLAAACAATCKRKAALEN